MFYKSLKAFRFYSLIIFLLLLSSCSNYKEVPSLTIVVPFNGYKAYLEVEVMKGFLNSLDNELKVEIVSLYGNKYEDDMWYKLPDDLKKIENADIFMGFTHNQYDLMVDKRLLLDITSEVDKWSNKIYEPILNSWESGGKYYGISPGFFNYALAYNTDLINISKIPIKDDFLLTLETESNYKIALPGVNSYSFLYNFLHRPYEEYLFSKDNNEIKIVNKDRMEMFKNMIHRNKNQYSINIDDFWYGKLELAVVSPKDIDFYIGGKKDLQFKDIRYDLVPLPSLIGDNDKGYAIPGDMLGIATESQNSDSAIELMKYILFNYKVTVNDSGSMGNLPVYNYKNWDDYEKYKSFYDDKTVPKMDVIKLRMSEYREATSIFEDEFGQLDDNYFPEDFSFLIDEKLKQIK